MDTRKIAVTGIKRFKGDVEGKTYDSCTVFVQLPVDSADGNGAGFVTEGFRYGSAENFSQFAGRAFPIHCEADFQVVSNGKGGVKQQLTAIRLPVAAAKAA